MNIFFSHNSALGYWRTVDAPCGSLSRIQPMSKTVPQESSLDWSLLESVGLHKLPLHTVVLDAASRSKSKTIVSYMWQGSSRAASFFLVGKGLYVSSPEACFVQLAAILPLVELIELGMEFCGSYAKAPNEGMGFRKRNPLTTVRSMQKYVSKLTGVRGYKNAKRALNYLVEGSASPMETILIMLLCLPTSLGGYGLELPECNYRIEGSSGFGMAKRRICYYCDLYWPRKNIAMEYDSDMFHTGSGRIAKDSRRRNDLLARDVSVISVTRKQVFDAREFERVVHILTKLLKVRLRSERPDILTRRFLLRQQLVGALRFSGVNKENGGQREYIDL